MLGRFLVVGFFLAALTAMVVAVIVVAAGIIAPLV